MHVAELQNRRPEKWLNPEQAAEYANVGIEKIYRACALGRLQNRRPGGGRTIVMTREWIDAWIVGPDAQN